MGNIRQFYGQDIHTHTQKKQKQKGQGKKNRSRFFNEKFHR